jgi:pimeloyl-ACP methyl ester carboxylesterase
MNTKLIIFLIYLLTSSLLFAKNQIFDFKSNSKIVQTNSGSFPLVDYGSGAPVLLLHGFPDSKELWKYQIVSFAKAGYRVIAPDLRGYGDAPSPLEKEKYTIPILMDDVIKILDTLKLDKVHLIGHDWGAALSWQLAKYYEHRFITMTVLSVGYPGNSEWNSVEQRQKSWYFYLFLQEGLAEKTLADYDWEFGKEILKSHGDRDYVLKRLQQPNALTTALNWYRGNLQNRLAQPGVEYPITNEKPQLSTDKIEIPVLGIWSDQDNFLLEPQMQLSSLFVNNFTYHKIAGAGHWMMLEKPEELNMLILDYLDNSKD